MHISSQPYSNNYTSGITWLNGGEGDDYDDEMMMTLWWHAGEMITMRATARADGDEDNDYDSNYDDTDDCDGGGWWC